MLKKSTIIGLTLNLCVALSAIAEEPHIYVIPGDAHCVVKRQTRMTYCTDKEGNPITGELHKYKDNILMRIYPLENGYLNGMAVNFDTKGRKTTEKSYVSGILEGISKTYYPTGIVESETEYTHGKKNGIVKFYDERGGLTVQAIYQNNRLNGKMQIYSPKKELLYNLKNVDNKYVSGTYYYLDANDEETSTEIPAIIIEAVNQNCLEFQTEKTNSACAVIFNPENSDCNAEWRQKNRLAVRKYLASCRKENR